MVNIRIIERRRAVGRADGWIGSTFLPEFTRR
jgi:hypothetical protein